MSPFVLKMGVSRWHTTASTTVSWSTQAYCRPTLWQRMGTFSQLTLSLSTLFRLFFLCPSPSPTPTVRLEPELQELAGALIASLVFWLASQLENINQPFLESKSLGNKEQ